MFQHPGAQEGEIRIIVFSGDGGTGAEDGPYYIIGDRDHLLYGAGDLVGDPRAQIVELAKPLAERIAASIRGPDVTAFYLRVDEKGSFQANTIWRINFSRLRTALMNAVEFKSTQTPEALLSNWCEYHRKFLLQEDCQKTLEELYLLPYITVPLPIKLEF